jgi:hypothetical protein
VKIDIVRGSGCVAEVAGFETSFSVSERFVQKLWLRRECAQSGFTVGGEPFQILDPGEWNLGAGPDFRKGRWVRGGMEERGDIEVHLRARDWFGHGHDTDPAYDGVRLHLVLYPPMPGEPMPMTSAGGRPPQIALLPLLRCGLEELVQDDALAELTGRDYLGLAERWAASGRECIEKSCEAGASDRWESKVRFARMRLERLGWEEACHGLALEVSGLRANRAAMATVGARWSLDRFRSAKPALEDLLGCEAAAWQWRGVRPSNRPEARLRQYMSLVEAAPDWPERLRSWLQELGSGPCLGAIRLSEVARLRRDGRLTGFSERLAGAVLWGCVGGTRLNNWAVDLALPLGGACSSLQIDAERLRAAWWAWWPADAPDGVADLLRAGGLTGEGIPVGNGHVQAVLGAMLRERGLKSSTCATD